MKWNTKRLMAIVLMLLLSAGICAIAESADTIYLPKDLKIIKANTFRNGTSIDKVVVPEGVTQILNKAFAYSSLKEITLPISLTFIAEDAFEGCGMFSVNVPEGCYAYDWCVEHGYIKKPLEITSLKCSHDDTAQIGNTITWTIQTTGGRGTIFNSFNIYLNDVLITSQDSNAQNYISFTPDSAGIYRLDVSSCDAEGMKSSTKTVSINVLEKPVEITEIVSNNGIVVEGDTLTWNILTKNGTQPLQFSYEVLINEESVAILEKTDASQYSYNAQCAGNYTLTVKCQDASGQITTKQSIPVYVYSAKEVIPSAPELTLSNDFAGFSLEESTAPEYEPQRFDLSWSASEYADTYEVKLLRFENDEWVTVLDESAIKACSYALSSKHFNSISESTSFRLELTSQGLRTGEKSVYYFKITPAVIDNSITINGSNSVSWDQNSCYASTRTFAIASKLEWKVESVVPQHLWDDDTYDVKWIKYTINDNNLIVTIDESTEDRRALITLSNGSHTAEISIRQYFAESAPIVTYPTTFSTEKNSPTIYPVGEFDLRWNSNNNNYTRIRIYELMNDDTLRLIHEDITSYDYKYIRENKLGESLNANTTYVFELAGVYSSSYSSNEIENDILKNIYYVRMSENGHYIKINNIDSVTYKNIQFQSCFITASNYFSCNSDVDWIAFEDTYVTKNSSYINIDADINETGTTRTGHLYFTCGNATATATVIQDDMSLKIMYPESLSKDEANPTKLYMNLNALATNYFYFVYQGEDLYIEKHTRNGYGDKVRISNQSEFGIHEAVIETDDVSGSTYCRLTVSHGGYNEAYYISFKNSNKKYDAFLNTYLSREEGAYEHTITLHSDATTDWTVSSNVNWLIPSATSGKAGATLTLTILENTTGEPRTGRLTFKSTKNDSIKWQDIHQYGEDYFALYYNDPDSNRFKLYNPDTDCIQLYRGRGDKTASFKVYATDDIDILCNVKWISSSEKNITSGKTFTFEIDENPAENGIRTGMVVITNGIFSQEVKITQAPNLGTVELISPKLSSDKNNPSVISYDGLNITWKAVTNASFYTVTVKDGTVYHDIAEFKDTGASQYTCFIPINIMTPFVKNYVSIYAYDQYGYSTYDNFYFIPVSEDSVLINGSSTPMWENVVDINVSKDFIIQSTDQWTAVADQSWITLSTTNGTPGDVLTVTLAENVSSSPRSGKVTISVGNASTILSVQQCAYLAEEFPSLTSPVLSKDKATPTLITYTDNSLTFTWENEPQADFYVLEVLSQKSDNVKSVIAYSPNLKNGENSYTFTNLELSPGELYTIEIMRQSKRWHATATAYYFMLADENAWILVDGEVSAEMEANGSEDRESFTITSSGYWVAHTENDWIMLHKRSVSQDDLDEDGKTSSDYAQYSNVSGSNLYVSVLANPNNTPRTGTVTISSGGATATITVYQYQNYSIGKLTSPNIGTTSSNLSDIPYGPVTFRWSSGNGGTGRYELLLEYKHPTWGWEEVIDVDGLTATSYTVPVSKLTEGCEYRLWLGTEIIDGDYAGERYYFRLQYEEQLTPEISVDWSNAKIGGWVEVHGTATGGAGDYSIAYELLCDGIQAGITTWNAESYYQFPITKAGNYQVRLYVKDAQDNQKDILSDSYTVGGNSTASYLNLSQTAWAVDAAGDTLNLQVDSSHNWTYTTSDSWISVSASDKQASITVGSNTSTQARNGHVLFATASKSVTLYITQHAMEETDVSSITLSRSVWNLLNPSASMINLSITSSDSWSVSGQPAWIKLSQTSGTGNTTISIYAENNNGGTRSAELVFSISGNAKKLLVTQVGADVAAQVLSVNVSNTSPLTGESVVFTIRTKNADELLYIVDGQLIDSITVIQDTVRYSYTYSLAKEEGREVYFIPRRNGVQGLVSEPLMMNVVSYGTLANTIIQEVRKVNIGDDAYISWTAVPNADSYTVYLYHNNVAVFKEPGIKDTFLTIEHKDLPGVGSYTLLVMATGKGYNQSKSADILKISTPEETFELTEPKSSYTFDVGNRIDIKISNPDGYMLQAQVKKDGKVVALFPSSGPAADKNPIYSFAASEGGEYEFSILAFNAAGSLQWNEGETLVSVNVNGPEFMAGSRIGTGARVMLAENATSFRIVTNTAITKIVVNDGVQDYISEEPVLNTSGAWTHVFTGTMNTPAPGKHIYNVIAYDEYNHTISKQFAIFAAERINKQTLYPQASSVSVLSAPNQGVSATLYPSDKVSVLGQFGDYWYVDFGGTKGVVSKNKLGMTRLTSWDGLTVALLPDTSKTTFYYTQKTPELIVRWKSSVELPDSAYYRLSYIRDIDGEQKVVYSGNNTYAEFSTTSMGYGLLRARVEVVSREDGIVYYTVDEGGGTFVTDSFELYIQLVKPEDYDWYLNGIDSSSETLIKSHLLFTTGYSDDDGEKIGPIDFSSITDGFVTKTYAILFGDAATSTESKYARCGFIAEQIMANCSNVTSSSWFVPFETFEKMIGFIDSADNIDQGVWQLSDIATITKNGQKMVKIDEDTIGHIESIAKVKNSNWYNETFTELKDVASFSQAFFSMIKKYIAYSNVDQTKLDIYIKALDASGNTDLQYIAQLLRDMNSGTDPLLCYLIKSYGFKSLADSLKTGVTNSISSLIDICPHGWAVNTSLKIGTQIGTGINEAVLNINDIQANAYQLKWAVQCADNFMSYFNKIRAKFRSDPMKYYDEFLEACHTFEELIVMEYELFKKIPEALDESLWNRIKNWVSHSDGYKTSIENISVMCDLVDGYVSNWVKNFYNNCLINLE